MEKYKEIERSIIKKYLKEIWSKFVKAVQKYQLISGMVEEGLKFAKNGKNLSLSMIGQ